MGFLCDVAFFLIKPMVIPLFSLPLGLVPRPRFWLAPVLALVTLGATPHVLLADMTGDHAHDHQAQEQDDSNLNQGGDRHHHATLQVAPSDPIPSVQVVAHPDAMGGWNLELTLEQFQFAPERVNQPGVTYEGHAHLYVDGEKVTRLYSTWYYLAPLTPGNHEVQVVLNGNGHETIVDTQGQPIQSTVMVTAD